MPIPDKKRGFERSPNGTYIIDNRIVTNVATKMSNSNQFLSYAKK